MSALDLTSLGLLGGGQMTMNTAAQSSFRTCGRVNANEGTPNTWLNRRTVPVNIHSQRVEAKRKPAFR